jgi:hypothetical protein
MFVLLSLLTSAGEVNGQTQIARRFKQISFTP